MNCGKVSSLLSCYLDGEVGERERRSVEEHLRHCASCRLMKEDYETVGRLLKLTEQRTIQPFLWTRIAAGLGGSGRQQPWIAQIRTPWLSWAAALACTVVVVGFLFFVGIKVIPANETPYSNQAAQGQTATDAIDPVVFSTPAFVNDLSNPSVESVLANVLYRNGNGQTPQPKEVH